MEATILSLESRIGLLRRRRRVSLAKQLLAAFGPVLIVIVIVLALGGAGAMAGAR